ncbi:neprosin family prolyl endopeptidase [Kitasatospora sp. NPDC006697]|uniref:neprosin family prolyl endopeptidase n=1 Tax=Kitasatospora sp. NPDC006697 TaxID=3364020 RepID=UPI0036BD4EF2
MTTWKSRTARRRASRPRTAAAVMAAAALCSGLLGVAPAVAATPVAATAAPAPPPSMPPVAAPAANGPICWYGACYDYVSGHQWTDTTGAQVLMKIEAPVVNPARTGEHSLQEIALQNTARTSTVEIGWTVDPELNGDSRPHLFVYHWVDGQESCYNGCGFVQVSPAVQPGMPLPPHAAASFAIRNIHGDWWTFLDGLPVGYFPGSLWNGTYRSAQLVSVFGEVAENTADTPSCTQMGDGRYGTDGGSSWIRDYRIDGTADRPNLTVSATSPTHYDAGAVTATSFRLGGPGTGACTTAASTTG